MHTTSATEPPAVDTAAHTTPHTATHTRPPIARDRGSARHPPGERATEVLGRPGRRPRRADPCRARHLDRQHRASLHRPDCTSSGELQWLVTAYLMMSGGGLLLGGRIADVFSRRRVFMTGLALFTTASLVPGFADSGSQLIATRATQGLSAALLTPAALSLITTTYAGAQRSTALAMWGAVGSLASQAGCSSAACSPRGPAGRPSSGSTSRSVSSPSLVGRVIPADDRPPAPALRPPRCAPRHRRPRDPRLRPRRDRDPRLVVRTPGRPRRPRCLAGLPRPRAARRRPLFPPHIWKLQALVSGTGVMLGVTGILVGTVFLTSIFVQTVLGYSALQPASRSCRSRSRSPPAPPARHLLAPGRRAPSPPRAWSHDRRRPPAVTAAADARYITDLLPGLVPLGFGVGMVFVPVSVTSMNGIPARTPAWRPAS